MVHKTLLGLQYTNLKTVNCSKSINILLIVQSLRYNILYNSLKILPKLLYVNI